MLALDDRIVLPAGVHVEQDAVVDSLRRARYPVNATAAFVLHRAGRSLGEVAVELADAYRLEPERARHDVLAFSLELNRCLIANVCRGGRPLGRLRTLAGIALRLAPAGKLPPPLARRSPVDTSSPLRALLSTVSALRGRLALVLVLGAPLAAQLTLLSGGRAGPASVAVLVAVALGVALHEAAHAAALTGVGTALVLAGLRTSVVHAPVPAGRRWLVAAAGPIVPAGLGILVVGLGAALGVVEAACAGCALAGHSLGLTVLTGDGRTACGC